ncbi:MAG: polysaccharide lyase family protein, partial [Verrucomicrobiota bacterium]
TGVGEWRIVWKLPHTSTDWTFERIYCDSIRNWYWGTYTDFTSAQSTSIAEVIRLMTGVRAGQYDCKYEYSLEYQNAGCWGHASDVNKKGVWMVLGGYDYLNDGPIKNDLALAESYSLLHFGRNHYNASSTACAAGETWSKIYGPFLLYCNAVTNNTGAGNVLWADAKAQVQAEIAAWPYAWLTNSDYPAVNLRGAVSGKLILADPLKPALAAGTNTWVGLAQPDAGGNWQFESKRYQYWVHPDANGNFFIPAVRPGSYTLSAFTDGAVGEFTYSNSVTVAANATNALGNLTWTVPHPGGQIAWEIGVPDRRAGEFRHSTNYWYPFLWETYSNDFPNPLVYNVGSGNWSNDWNYAHSGYLVGTNWLPWKWRINFTLTNLPTSGSATLTFAFASINYGAVQVFVNDESTLLGEVAPTTAGGGTGGNALIREGNHAKYSLGYLSVPLSSLRIGTNTVTLLQRRSSASSDHVMYDYLSLELPASVVLPPGRPLVWRGGSAGNAWDVATTANFRDTNNNSVVFTNGDNVTFADSGATNPTVTLAQPLWPGSVSVITSSNYTITGSGSITGAVQLIKAGSGTLTVNTTNSLLTGTVSLSAGKITLGTAGASVGTGMLELNGGTFTLVNGGTLNNSVAVLAPSTVGNSGNSTISGALSGTSQLTAAPPTGNVLTLGGSAANFRGVITLGNGSGNFRFNQSGTWGVPNGTMDAGTNAGFVYTRATGGGTAYFGALSGGPRTTLTSSDQTNNPGAIVTYVVGALNQDSTFAGTNTDVGKAQLLALTKVGGGTLTLSGDSNYRGATRIGGGTLLVSGSITTTNFVVVSNTATLSLPGTITAGLVQINSGGSLTGCGAINGNLLNNGAVLADCGGALEISGNVTNNGSMQFVNGSGLAVAGTFVNNGLLDLLTGTQTLPPNFVNNGTVLLAANIVVTAFDRTGDTMSLTVYGYAGHTYQLQRASSLHGTWQNIGPAQDGAASLLTFEDVSGDSANFYRIAVAP